MVYRSKPLLNPNRTQQHAYASLRLPMDSCFICIFPVPPSLYLSPVPCISIPQNQHCFCLSPIASLALPLDLNPPLPVSSIRPLESVPDSGCLAFRLQSFTPTPAVPVAIGSITYQLDPFLTLDPFVPSYIWIPSEPKCNRHAIYDA